MRQPDKERVCVVKVRQSIVLSKKNELLATARIFRGSVPTLKPNWQTKYRLNISAFENTWGLVTRLACDWPRAHARYILRESRRQWAWKRDSVSDSVRWQALPISLFWLAFVWLPSAARVERCVGDVRAVLRGLVGIFRRTCELRTRRGHFETAIIE